MIFTRKIDDGLASLVKKLDTLVADNEEKGMAALVNFVGEDAEALQKAAAEFAQRHKISNAALVVPRENVDGPKLYGISAQTSLAVILYSGKKVKVLHTLADGQLDKDRIAAIVADTGKILTEEETPGSEKRKNRKKSEGNDK